jgi:O-antigen ligase
MTYSHNSYILILSELGLIGGIWFLVFITKLFYSGNKTLQNLRKLNDKSMFMIQVGTMTAIVANLVLFFTYGSWLINLNFWLACALLSILGKVAQENKTVKV